MNKNSLSELDTRKQEYKGECGISLVARTKTSYKCTELVKDENTVQSISNEVGEIEEKQQFSSSTITQDIKTKHN